MSRLLDLAACLLMVLGFALAWFSDDDDDPYNTHGMF